MSLLTDEGLPDPANMNFFAQMTFGQLENWWAQTQELGAALGLDGWSGPDAEQHRQFLLQDHQSSQQHQDAMHIVAEGVLWVIDTLQLIMTILLIIQIIRLAILACSTIAAIFTAGFSEAVAADLTIQLAIMEGIKRAVIFALRQMIKLIFDALPKLLLRLLPGEVAGAATGAVVAANTVSDQHLSGGAAVGVFLQDMGFGALTGATLQAGLSSGNPLAWKLLGGGVATTSANAWAQSEVTGQGPTLQSVFDSANADLMLPEGTLQVGEAASEVNAFRVRRQLGASLDGPVGVESQCGPAALYDKLALFGALSADASWRPSAGTWLSEGGPKAMAAAFAGDPSILERMGASPDIVSVARQAQAGDPAALARLEATFQLKGGLSLNDLNRAYTSTGMTVTVVTRLDDGAHAVEFAGLRDGKVFLVDGSTGKVTSLAALDFLSEWRGGQALMPDLEALGITSEVARLNPLTRAYESLTGLDTVRGIAPETVDELPVKGSRRPNPRRTPEPKILRQLQSDVRAGHATFRVLDPSIPADNAILGARATAEPYWQDAVEMHDRAVVSRSVPVEGGIHATGQPGAGKYASCVIGDPSTPSLTRSFSTGLGTADDVALSEKVLAEASAPRATSLPPSSWDPPSKPGLHQASHAELKGELYLETQGPAGTGAIVTRPMGVSMEQCMPCRIRLHEAAMTHNIDLVVYNGDTTRIFFANGEVGIIANGDNPPRLFIYTGTYAVTEWNNFMLRNARSWLNYGTYQYQVP
jgi:hypothetical protein